jgi:O-antigen/teichoic acid export membrane protein
VSAVRIVIFPAAARASSATERIDIISRSLRLALLLVVTLSVPLFFAAPFLVPFVYGESFAPAVASLRILLIGFVFRTGSSIVVAGLKAANRPLGASVGELAAIPITLVGLVLVLNPYGIEGAATVSTIAYGVAFLVGLRMMSKQDGVPLSELLSLRRTLEDAMHLGRRGWRAVPRPDRTGHGRDPGATSEASVEERA